MDKVQEISVVLVTYTKHKDYPTFIKKSPRLKKEAAEMCSTSGL